MKEKEKELGGPQGAVKDDDFRKDTLEWGCHVVPSTGLIEMQEL